MSEKLHGVRAWWNGQQFLSRQGNNFLAPAWFTDELPDTPLDGELWMDRKSFQRTVSIVRRQDRSDHWKQIQYVVFDAPSLDAPFEERLSFVTKCVNEIDSSVIAVLKHQCCKELDHLPSEPERIEYWAVKDRRCARSVSGMRFADRHYC